MPFFKGRHSARWHREIDVTYASHRSLNTGSEQSHFPAAELQEHTNTYLRRVGRSTIAEQDHRLTALVKEHQEMHVAIVACAHALSPRCVRNLLRGGMPADAQDYLSTSLYLKTIMAGFNANPGAIDALEAGCAQHLFSLLFSDVLNVGENLRKLASCTSKMSMIGIPNDLLPPKALESIPLKACALLSSELQNMKLESRWKQAQRATSSLSRLSGEGRSMEQLLDSSVSGWRTWALWRPDSQRLEIWERLTPEQRLDLGDILALEGPDFASGRKSTLREALRPEGADQSGFSISHGRFRVKLWGALVTEAQQLLDRLINILCAACSISANSIALFIHLCVHNSVGSWALRVLECVNATKSHLLTKGVLDMLTGPVNSVRMTGVLDTISVLNLSHHQRLRDVLSLQTISTAEDVMIVLQEKFGKNLQSGRNVETAGMNLHEFGQSIKATQWLQPVLSERLQLLLRHWPSTQDMKGLFNIRSEAKCTGKNGENRLAQSIDAYCMSYLAGRGTIDDEMRTVEGLIRLWQQPPDRQRRDIAVEIAESTTIDPAVRRRCLIQVSKMADRFIRESYAVVGRDSDDACIKFTRVLLIPRLIDDDEIDCWRDLLRCMIERRKSTLLDYTFTHFPTAGSWLQWVNDVRTYFGGSQDDSPPWSPILSPKLHLWAETLSRSYVPVLTCLEKDYRFKSTMRSVLLGWEVSKSIIPVLKFMKASNGSHDHRGIQPIIEKITPNGGNIGEIFNALFLFLQTDRYGKHACTRVLKAHQNLSEDTAGFFLAGWLGDSELVRSGKQALVVIAEILGLRVSRGDSVSTSVVKAAFDRLDTEFDSLIDRAVDFESKRLTLQKHDPRKTSELLKRLGIHDQSAAETSTLNIPSSIFHVVEEINDGEFELLFPLNHKRPFQRTALGVGDSRMLLMRLLIRNGSKVPEFCIHLHPGGNNNTGSIASTGRHTYHRVDQRSCVPNTEFCHGRGGRFTYQLNRAIWRYLKIGFVSLEATWNFVEAAIDNLGNNCVVCGTPLGARMWRSTTCQKACSIALRKSSLEVRLADYCFDPSIVDLLLNIVKCAADCHDLDLLPGCPVQTEASLTQTLQTLPAVWTIQGSRNISKSIGNLGKDAEALLSWLCTSYRGFLACARHGLKIPSMAGVDQFVLANATPELEKKFAAHVTPSQPTTRVVFHGTSFDRLYLILCHGLQPGAGKWQRHGAAYGPGIYLADEPSTALSFASASQSTWTRSSLQTCKIVLGVELAGDKPAVASGIHVATDPSTVIVRYVFMFPRGAVTPDARHVVPAMKIAFASLRRGSV